MNEEETKLLAACMTGGTAPFGEHPNDEAGAYEFLGYCLKERKTWSAVTNLIEDYLARYNTTKNTIQKQIERAKPLISPWLDD